MSDEHCHLKIQPDMSTAKFLACCIAAYAIVATLASCCKSCADEKPQVMLSFKKYQKGEIDTIVELRYQPNTNFSILIDSFTTARYWYSNDTTYSYGDFTPLPVGADYIVKITSLGKVFTFSNYQISQGECGCEHKRVDMLSSFTMDGNVLQNTFVELPR